MIGLLLPWTVAHADPARVERVLASLDRDGRIDQMLLAYPQLDRDGPVTVGGVLFVGAALRDVERVAASTLARAVIPPLLAVDLEGGEVSALFGPLPSARALGRLSDAEVEAWGTVAGERMRRIGLNTDLAPVLDVASAGEMFVHQRTFGGDPAIVAARGGAFARGLERAGVAAVAKHFPGYGDLAGSTDRGPVSAAWSTDRIASGAAVFDAVDGLDGVMVSNVVYRAVGDLPAAMTPSWVAAARRGDRLVFTDDLSIATLATAVGGTPEDVVQAAFLAGNDVLVTTAPPDWKVDYHGVVADTVQDDPQLEQRVDDSVRRILMLKDRLGLLEGL